MTDKNKTHILAILDRSGSMRPLVSETIGGYNSYIKLQRDAPGEATVSLVIFDDTVDPVYENVNVNDDKAFIDEDTYFARGWTALYDAVGRGIVTLGEELAAMPEDQRPGKVIVLIVTDGEENSSKEYSQDSVREMIEHQKTNYQWEFVYMGGGDIEKQRVQAVGMGVSANNAYGYSTKGNIGTQNLYRAAAAGTVRTRKLAAQGVVRSVDDSFLDAAEVRSLVND